MLKPTYITYIITALLMLVMPCGARAFDTSVYAEKSALAEGRWVKVRVDADGLYCIPASRLRSWGFNDPAKVVVRGYGGRRQNDVLSLSNYIDDLPAVQSVVTSQGIVFYGIGAGEWTRSGSNGYYYAQNDYSSSGYYFVGELADGEEARSIAATGYAPGGDAALAGSYMCRLHHEQELTQVQGEAGPLLLGEDMRFTTRRKVSFATPDAVPGGTLSYQVSIITAMDGRGSLKISLFGSEASSTTIEATSKSDYIHGTETIARNSIGIVSPTPASAEVEVAFNGGGTVSAANLNYVSINYERRLAIPTAGYISFSTDKAANQLACADASALTLWDVTDPLEIKAVDGAAGDGAYRWGISGTAMRDYAAFTDASRMPAPAVVGTVSNQNLHALKDIDMVIVTPAAFREQAVRLADFHAASADSLAVAVVTPDEIYNEFSSGTPDIGGIRRFFKMLYDRGGLRYAILFARTTLDNRGLTAYAPTYPTLPSWMPRGAAASLSDNTGYCSDDITAMLEDGSGAMMSTDKLSIAIGRMPVTSVLEARNVVDKSIEYVNKSKKSAWKHRFLFLCDDEDNGIHLDQTEALLGQYDTAGGGDMLPRKIYIDAYDYVGSTYPTRATPCTVCSTKALCGGTSWATPVRRAGPKRACCRIATSTASTCATGHLSMPPPATSCASTRAVSAAAS